MGNSPIKMFKSFVTGFLGSSVVKNLPAMWEMWVRSSGEGNGNPLQYSCLGNPMNKGAWKVTVHKVAKSLI